MGKADAGTKEFWRDNERFADLFNAVIFSGEPIIRPEDLTEMDTEASMMLKTEKTYIQTITKSRDLIRKYSSGAEFVLLGLENQQKINYAEPVCIMAYDAAGYWKECRSISNRSKKDRENLETGRTEIFSLERGIKLHPVITVVLYYGEEPWDGPKSLHEMLVPTPEKMLKMVPDYPVNLVEIRKDEGLIFHNPEVRQVFWALPKIYQGKIEELEGVMVRKEAAELIGTVTGSKTLINMAKRRKKGEDMKLCNSLKKLAEEHEKIGEARGEARGESRGLEKGVTKGRILTYHDVGWEEAQIAEKLKISRKEVRKVLKKAGESK